MKHQGSEFYRYWGKALQSGSTSEETRYHLLPYHCLDVAAAGWWLLAPETAFSKHFSMQLSVSPEWLQHWFSFCLSIHDIGKFAVAFQGIVPNTLGFLVDADQRRTYTVPHDTLGYALWRKFLCSEWQKLDPPCDRASKSEWKKILRSMNSWMELATGHHGRPPLKGNVHLPFFFTKQDQQASLQYVIAVSYLFLNQLDLKLLINTAMKKHLKKLSWALAGAVVMADWIGSGIDSSRYRSEPLDLKVYWNEYALPEAKQRLKDIEGEKPTVAPFGGIEHLFPFIESPTPLQQWAADVPLPEGPQLFILEDVTGAGKTEAALVLAHRLMSRLPAEGVYIALPTMATANAMYDRLGKAYRRLFTNDVRPSLVLSHGARHLSESFRTSVGLPSTQSDEINYAKDEDAGGVFCRTWLADSRKKALLAEVGVGTIDQALLAVLPAKHQCLRLLGLQGKILIVDEVHAYDSYMNRLLRRLLEVHAMNGGCAILLSATLPRSMRVEFVESFCRGADLPAPDLLENPPYPLATHVPNVSGPETPIDTRPTVKREVDVVFVNEFGEVVEVIRKALENNRCICWIRNTVKDALEAFGLLSNESGLNIPTDRLVLFHSRFAMMDRQRIETDVLSRFGKDSTAKDRCGQVLVATQVVEQSLDLDFDEMISDIAPVDLLVQRAGRLHRHVRDNNGNRLHKHTDMDERGKPVFHVFGPKLSDNPDETWLKNILPGTQAIYPHVGKIWLTQRCLLKSGAIRTPYNCRALIESVYSDEAQDDIPENLLDASWDAEGEDAGMRSMATINALKLERGYTLGADTSGGWTDEARITTRLSDNSVTAALAVIDNGELLPYARSGSFAWDLSIISLPKSDWKSVISMIPAEWEEKIQRLKETEKGLKWIEVLPLTPEINACYHSRTGWRLKKEV